VINATNTLNQTQLRSQLAWRLLKRLPTTVSSGVPGFSRRHFFIYVIILSRICHSDSHGVLGLAEGVHLLVLHAMLMCLMLKMRMRPPIAHAIARASTPPCPRPLRPAAEPCPHSLGSPIEGQLVTLRVHATLTAGAAACCRVQIVNVVSRDEVGDTPPPLARAVLTTAVADHERGALPIVEDFGGYVVEPKERPRELRHRIATMGETPVTPDADGGSIDCREGGVAGPRLAKRVNVANCHAQPVRPTPARVALQLECGESREGCAEGVAREVDYCRRGGRG
jgi:hypothetical protein